MRYQTAQRERLTTFFEKHPNRQYTIESLEEAVRGISKSAIYRNINQMVEDGAVRRFQKEGSRKFLYQYMGDPACSNHLHLTCSDCGVVYHMDTPSSVVVSNTLTTLANFNLDTSKTMLFGHCSSCK